MSERRCRQVVNRFGYPLAGWMGCVVMLHDEADMTSGCAERQKDCLHHEPLYAEPVADTTTEVGEREQCVRLDCATNRERLLQCVSCFHPQVCHPSSGPSWHEFYRHPMAPPQPAADAHRHKIRMYARMDYLFSCTECPVNWSFETVCALLNEHAGGK